MELQKTYKKVNAILNGIDFHALLEGFHPYRFALYSSSEIILDGKAIPYQEDFRGNTSILYDGEYIAIWNLEFDPMDDVERLAYCLVHEMFHCHQRTHNETRYPSDLELLNYPNDVNNFTKKYNENRYLANAFASRDITLLRQFACIRKMRYETYPAMVRQELKAETLEGMAEYIGLKALQQINAEKYDAVIRDYLDKLRAESNLLFDVRRMSYYTGTIYFLCLERFGFPLTNAFDSDLTAYEQNHIDIAGMTAEIHAYDFISSNAKKLMEEKRAKVEEHIRQSSYTETQAYICGYDPMNMFRVGDVIYCSHFVCLKEGGKINMIHSAVALKLAENSNQNVVGYYL